MAKKRPDDEVVFWGVGFETTSPTVAASLLMAQAGGIKNFSVLASHKLLPPALFALLASDCLDLQGFLLPGHVCATIGAEVFQPLAGALWSSLRGGRIRTGRHSWGGADAGQAMPGHTPRVEIQYKRAVAIEAMPGPWQS